MRALHHVVSAGSEPKRAPSIVVVVCAYCCAPAVPDQAERAWREALELARAGLDVWVVTPSDERARVESALAAADVDGLHVLFWDARPLLRPLRRWHLGARLHRALWYRLIGGAIADWQRAVGMSVLRRAVHASGASVTYLAMPSVQRGARARFTWHPLSE